jgi:hypothetical protein
LPSEQVFPGFDAASIRTPGAGVDQADWATGRKMEKVVPERPGFTELLNRIVPPCFLTMPSDTHNPIPVPLLPFVV